MTEEIKPCPFCGSEVTETRQRNAFYYVTCWNCRAESNLQLTKTSAIEIWNRRPYDYDMPAIVKKVQQLEKENEQLKKMLALGVNYERANG